MKNETPAAISKTWPKLLAEQNEGGPKSETGFLQLTGTDKKIKIGDTLGREFRLLQCLFSAQNFLSAKYAPVTQTYERLYGAIQITGDSLNEKLSNVKSVDTEKARIVRTAVRGLQQSDAGKYLIFMHIDDKLRMEIAGATAY